ncbi:MAG TPA: anhydro-N-acetylmuramic acid kinase [Saprospiraceae bacterium]|nr:anhydro-N-acetylmuramic acid kinase [Saprospiraceae bacterium]
MARVDAQMILGVMSGSSLDGMDMALCKFSNRNSYEILEAATIPYSQTIYKGLSRIFSMDLKDYFGFVGEFNQYYSQTIKEFLQTLPYPPELIVSHGHTLYHNPEGMVSVQIGNGGVIASTCGINTLCDLRIQDIALGGQGAPLASLADALLLSEYDVLVNLGGIANVSVRQEGKSLISWDFAPCNQVLNALANKLGMEFDKGGHVASKGHMLDGLFKFWAQNAYFRLPPPKSMDNAWLKQQFIDPISEQYSIADVMFTFTHFIAHRLVEDIKPYLQRRYGKTMLVTGGGAHNTYLMEAIREVTGQNGFQLIEAGKILINFKEALLMAYMGYRYLCGEYNIVSSATGGMKNIVAGALYLANE